MDWTEIRDALIEAGLGSIRKSYPEGTSKFIGGIAGFEACRDLVTRADFQRALKDQYDNEIILRDEQYRTSDEVDKDRYWAERYHTLQIEYIYKVLQVHEGDKEVSSRAAMRYMEVTAALVTGGPLD